MTDSDEKQKMDNLEPGLQKFHAIIKQSSVIEEGIPTRYHLTPTTDSHDQSEHYKKMTVGERDKTKPHKTILMVGETGTGKTKLINTMINYMLDVQREDKVWFEITDDQSDQTSVYSQTSIITVYGFYLQESKTDLTIIDTPGYGDTRGVEKDKEIAESLLSLIKSAGINELDAVCLVIKATQTRLSDRELYIFDAVQSLFGSNIAENIVLLFTHSRGAIPKSVLMAVEEDQIKCAVNEQNQPVYFLFDNCQSDAANEENIMLKQSWDLSFKGITGFFKFLDNIKPKTVKMTQHVLQQQRQLEAKISNIKSHIQEMVPKQNELKHTQEDLEKHKQVVEENKNFENEVEVKYKEKVDIDHSKACLAVCCSVCEENCHYPDSSWITPVSWSSVMKDNHCTVCTNKCHSSKHAKEAKIYETKTKKEKRTDEDLKKKYDDNIIKVRDGEILVKRLKEELHKLEIERVKLVMDAFHCVNTLEMIALNTDSLNTLRHADLLIEKLKEINEPEKVEILEDIKKRAGEDKHKVLLENIYIKSEN